MFEGRQVIGGDLVVVDQGADGRLGCHLRQVLNVLGGPTEPGAAKQMFGAVVVPIVGSEGCEIAGPRGGTGRPRPLAGRAVVGGQDACKHKRGDRRKPVLSTRHGLDPLIRIVAHGVLGGAVRRRQRGARLPSAFRYTPSHSGCGEEFSFMSSSFRNALNWVQAEAVAPSPEAQKTASKLLWTKALV